MNSFKDFAMEYDYLLSKMSDEQFADLIDRKILEQYLIECVLKKEVPENPQLVEFLTAVLPKTDYFYHVFVQESEAVYANLWFKYDDYIKALCVLAECDEYNVYYNITPFVTKNENTEKSYGVKCFCIDIDELPDDTDVSEMDKNELFAFLIYAYHLENLPKPNFLLKSGRGVHLYFVLQDELTDKNLREGIFDRVNLHFHGDIANRSRVHGLRLPTSYNVKRDMPVRSVLCLVNSDGDLSLRRMNKFTATADEIEAYRSECIAKKAEKARRTKEKNRLLKENQQTEDKTIPKTKPKQNKRTAVKNTAEYPRNNNREITLKYYTTFNPKHKNWNVVKDLHNFVARNGGADFLCERHMRNRFLFIMASYCQRLMPENDCFEFCKQYVGEDFFVELERLVRSCYARANPLRYSLFRIAADLNFSEFDIEQSYCNFSKERRSKARKANIKKQNDKRYADSRKRKQEVSEYIQAHRDTPAKQLAKECGVSLATIYRKLCITNADI